MFLSGRKTAAPRVVLARPVTIEGLEGRCLLSGSPWSTGGAVRVDNSGPGVKLPQQDSSSGKNASVGKEIEGVVTVVDAVGGTITVAGKNGGRADDFLHPCQCDRHC